ncbi:MAG: FHA domain-containing protein [Actinomycetes bacterium]
MPTHCGTCGASTADADRFCRNCGAGLVATMDPITATGTVPVHDSGELPQFDATGGVVLGLGEAALVVTRGPGAGEYFLLTGSPVTVGRAPDCGIFLDDVTVSRHHAQFRTVEAGWELVDTGSLNGTYVNRTRIDSQELHDHDEVQIGKYRFGYRWGTPADAE